MSSSLWFPFTPMQECATAPPLRIVRGEGNTLYDDQGRPYLDGISSLWTNVHGHNHPTINQAITQQLEQIAHTTLLGLSNSPAEALADELVAITPKSLQHVFFSDSGSTAVEIALKQAFQFWQLSGKPDKQRFVYLKEAYHGDTVGAVGVGGIDIFHQIFGPMLGAKNYSIPSPHAPQGMDRARAAEASLQALEKLLQSSSSGIAALIIEPLVQGAGGILVQPPSYLKDVANLCRRHDVLLIADEVATGFGRTGKMFACEHEDVEPDFLCLAKGITGGYLPLAATLSTSRVFEAFLAPREKLKTFFHGHTYTGNPLACAAGLASLKVFREERTLEKLPAKIEMLQQQLELLAAHPHVGQIRQRGLMVGVDLVESKSPNHQPFPFSKFAGNQVCSLVRNHGVILRNLGDTVVLMPPLSITDSEICTIVHSLTMALDELPA